MSMVGNTVSGASTAREGGREDAPGGGDDEDGPGERVGAGSGLDLLARHGSVVEQVIAQFCWYRDSVADQEDLRQEALIGLLCAARTFDPARGTSFRAYARACVRNAVTDALRRCDPLPPQARADLRAIHGVGEGGGPAELARACGLAPQRVQRAQALAGMRPLVGADGSWQDLADATCLTPEEMVVDAEEVVRVRRAVQGLTGQLREVVVLRMFAGASNDAVARALGVSPGRASQIWARGLQVLREAMEPSAVTERSAVTEPAGSPVVSAPRGRVLGLACAGPSSSVGVRRANVDVRSISVPAARRRRDAPGLSR